MNAEEALAQIFADQDSDVSDFSDSEFEAIVSEEEEEINEGKEDKSGEANIKDDELENARGPVQGNCGVRRTWEKARKGDQCQDYEGRARTTFGSKVDIS